MDTSLLEFIDQVDSTNTYLTGQIASGRDLPQLHTVVCRQQTAGRGMRGNTWTSRPGDSLTFSILLRSDMLQGKQQFAVSELAAWAVMRTFASYMTDDQKQQLRVKWPNDIFYGDRKLAGILIEHSLTGARVDYSVIGIGMNINDEAFPPELPSAISLRMITGRSLEPMEVLIRLHSELSQLLPRLPPRSQPRCAPPLYEVSVSQRWLLPLHRYPGAVPRTDQGRHSRRPPCPTA